MHRTLKMGLSCLLLAGCGGQKAAPPPQAAPAAPVNEPPKASAAAQALTKFQEFSKEIEKAGPDERLDPGHIEQEMTDIVRIDGSYSPARFNLGVLKDRAGDPEGGRQIFADIGSKDPQFVPAQENLAADLVKSGDIDKAAATYQQIIAKHPKNQTSRLALARIYSTQKKYDEAIALCRDVLQRQADAQEAFRVLAESYNAEGNTPMAELIIGRGLKAGKDDVHLHALLAQILLERDDLAGGVAKLKHVIRMDPKRLSARAQLADIALSYRDFGNAATQYEAILKDDPANIPVQIDLAVSYKGLGRFEQAEKIYKDVLAKDKDNVAALWNSGVLYHRHLNRYDEAIASLQHFKEVAPKDDDHVSQVDGLLADITKLKTDQAAQKEREEHDKKKKEALDAACAAVAANKPPDAAAIGADQERIEVAWQLMVNAQQAIQGGDVPNGEAAVHCAFAIVPNTPAANTGACAPMRVMWTQILYQLGRVDEASKTIQDALKCDPNNPDAQLIAQQLKELAAQQQPAQAPAQAPAPAPAPAPASGKGKK